MNRMKRESGESASVRVSSTRARHVNDATPLSPEWSITKLWLSPDGKNLRVGHFAQKYGQIHGGRPCRHFKKHIAHETAVITRVIDDVLHDFQARHRARVSADQCELHFLVQRGV